MGIVFRQSVKSSIIIILGALLGLLLNYIYPFTISKAQFGFYTNFIYTAAILQIVAMLGTGSLLAVFTQKYPVNDERRKVLIGIGILTTFFGTLILAAFLYFFKEKIIAGYHPNDQPYISEFYYLLPVLIFLWGLMSIFEHYLLSQIKVAKSAFIKEVVLRVLNFILIGFLFYGIIDFRSFIIYSVLLHSLPVIMMITVSMQTQGFGLSLNLKAFSISEYKAIAHFSWYHVLLGVSLNIMSYLDTLLLGKLDTTGMEASAPYRIAAMIITLMTLPYRAMSSASYATLNQAYIDNDLPKLRDLFVRAGLNIFIVATGVSLIILCNLDNITAIFPPGYEVIKPIIAILIIGKLVDMATGLNNELISISRYYKFNFRIAILLVVMVVIFDYMLIPRYSVYGAAWAATISLIIFNLLKVIYLWKKMRLLPFCKGTLWVVVAGILAAVVGYLIPFMKNILIDILFRSIIIGVLYVVLLLLFNASNDLTNYLKGVRRSKRLF